MSYSNLIVEDNSRLKTNLISINLSSSIPRYLQVAYSIKQAIEEDRMKKGDLLPSLNELADRLHISKDTVERGYKYLRKQGILNSSPGKGYFINNTEFQQQIRIFLLINKLSDYKKIFYDSFVSIIENEASIDLYVYHNDFVLFEKIINRAHTNYTHYLIMPHFHTEDANEHEVINRLPKSKLIMLDRKVDFVDGNYGGVYENFKKDIFNSLKKLLKPLSKYHTLKLLFPVKSYFPRQIIDGFDIFCQQYAFEREVLTAVEHIRMNKGEVFICLTEGQLLSVIQRLKQLNLKVGKDIGVISYNETPLKKYILNGITTISTDYSQMGIEAANMIRYNYRKQIELKCEVKLRKSL